MPTRYKYALVGGGLQNGLTALALLHRHPDASLVLIERDEALGGNHTWCFHADDVGASAAEFVAPLVTCRWDRYEVRFPRHARTLDAAYAAVTSERLHDVVRAAIERAPNATLMTGTLATAVDNERVELADGSRVEAEFTIDARGPEQGSVTEGATGYQKFVGLEFETETPHGLEAPYVMDATVEQIDGYRFMYVLPFTPRRVLLEDTYFSTSPHLDRAALRTRIRDYASAMGLPAGRLVREEAGVLPMPWEGGDVTAPGQEGPIEAGYQGGWFHPGTGYSFPTAVALAQTIASAPDDELRARVGALATQVRRQGKFARRLNKMLFRWFPPDQRVNVLERFYRLPDATIRRFYALQLTGADRARIFLGRPPRGMSLRAVLGRREAA